MFETGLSTCGKVPNGALFAQYAAAGISCAEISPDQGKYDEIDFGSIKESADRHGVKLWSFHLQYYPFTQVDISMPDESSREKAIKRLASQMSEAARIGIDKFVIHPSGEPIEECDRAAHMEASMKSLRTLAGYAESLGAVLAVEDLPRSCLGRDSGEMLELLSADPRLRCCFDTNHLLRGDPADFARAVGSRIVTLHVSDYDFTDEKHWLPGEGRIDWQALYAALREIGYSGVWMYELGFTPPRSMPRVRDLNCFDFARNAREIFDGGAALTRVDIAAR